ncbi:hypothetical protein ACXYMU_05420 [Pontibacter sp. CAU 1760]
MKPFITLLNVLLLAICLLTAVVNQDPILTEFLKGAVLLLFLNVFRLNTNSTLNL